MAISCNTIVDRRDHVQYLTVSKSYSDNCTCSLTEHNTTLKNLLSLAGSSSSCLSVGNNRFSFFH